ncbi:histamine H2 receptor-like [Acropora muricata]|uniref:histamine H2 receptor-like n=1 Tax=Acropora muricata TaxID=159855 RepID=UPI0034E53F52
MFNFTNFTRGSLQSESLLFCSAEVTAELHIQLKLLAVFYFVTAITATVGNVLILIALRKRTSLHPPSKVLFRSLAATDLCVGVFVQPCKVTYFLSVVHGKWQTCHLTYSLTYGLGSVLAGVSLWTLSAISVDRLLALLLGLRYQQVVTLKRVYAAVIAFWVISFTNVWIPVWNTTVWEIIATATSSLCLLVSFYCYCRIFCGLRRHQSLIIAEQENQTTQINLKRYRKAVSSAVWVQFALFLCYFPYLLVSPFAYQELRMRQSSAFYLTLEITVLFIYFNSSLNPILYCWKIAEVRQAVKEILRTLVCSSNQ